MKYSASNFLKFEMADEKSVSAQIIESKKLLSETSSEGLEMNDAFPPASLIRRLTPPWQELKNSRRNKHSDMSFTDLIVHVRVKEQNLCITESH